MKKLLALMLCAACLVSLAACGSRGEPEVTETDDSAEITGIANPFVDYDSLEDACAVVGFDFTVPETIGDCPIESVQVMDGRMIQVTYCDGEADGNRVILRKAAGTEDISGDYNQYDVGIVACGSERSAEFRGVEQDFYVATWTTIDGYTYALTTVLPMTSDDMSALIQSVDPS